MLYQPSCPVAKFFRRVTERCGRAASAPQEMSFPTVTGVEFPGFERDFRTIRAHACQARDTASGLAARCRCRTTRRNCARSAPGTGRALTVHGNHPAQRCVAHLGRPRLRVGEEEVLIADEALDRQ